LREKEPIEKLAKTAASEDLGHFPVATAGIMPASCFSVTPSAKKDGKEHRYWSIVENRRVGGGRVVQRPLLYLGEIQRFAGTGLAQVDRSSRRSGGARPLSLFPEDRCEGVLPDATVVRRSSPSCVVPAAAWWRVLAGGEPVARTGARPVLAERLGPSRKGTRWHQCCCSWRLPAAAPGSEWRLHRQWFEGSAMATCWRGCRTAETTSSTLSRSAARHKQALFDHLVGRWRDLFNVSFDVLLHDLTSTYIESDPPFPEGDKRRHGYSRDHRGDCVQVIIALVVTPEGLRSPTSAAGQYADNTTLKDFSPASWRNTARRADLADDRGVPTEAVLPRCALRSAGCSIWSHAEGASDPDGEGACRQALARRRPGVQVKLLPQDASSSLRPKHRPGCQGTAIRVAS